LRLQSIKLAGFKSFVDPTTVPFHSNMTAVVGPNGCGKSNIIDAVRWVMGESSAKHLRGESMADVIFNGSVSRKPVSRASIELVFDNTDGRAGGEFAQFNEISVRREVTRDGQSKYALNGSACRRRDVTDLFLGTGLGPRSYAIIEQGMIARIIEAKPEELRVYVEEAAGVSKYKERRRETENRINRTRDNLARLNDVSDELGRQLDRLKRQADAAERYKSLKAESRQLESLVRWYALQTVNDQARVHIDELDQHSRELDRVSSELATNERARIDAQVARDQANQALDEANSAYYAQAAKLSRLETQRAQQDEQIEAANRAFARIEADLEKFHQQLSDDRADGQTAADRKHELVPRLAELEASIEHVQNSIHGLEEQLAATDLSRGHLTSELSRMSSERSRLEAEQKSLDRQHTLEKARLEEVDHALTELSDTDPELIERVRRQLSDLEQSIASAHTTVLEHERAYDDAFAGLEQHQQALLALEADAQSLDAEMARIQRTLDAEARIDDQQTEDWIASQPAVHGRALAVIDVPKEARSAFEATYPEWLSAFVVDRLDDIDVTSLPAGVRVIERESLHALTRMLRYSEQVVFDAGEGYTHDGLKYGSGWVERVAHEATGVLDLQATLPGLRTQLDDLTREIEATRETRDHAEAARAGASDALQVVKTEAQSLQAEQVQLSHQLLGLESKAREVKASRDRLTRERANLVETLASVDQHRDALTSNLADVQAKHASLQAQIQPLEASVEQDKAALQSMRDERDRLGHARSDLRVEIERLDGQIARVETQVGRIQEQIDAQLVERKALEARRLELNEQPVVSEDDLNQAVAVSQSLEADLRAARETLSHADHRLRELESERIERERDRDRLNTAIADIRLKLQAVEIDRDRLQSELKTRDANEAALRELAQRLTTEQAATEELARVETRIERLGPINLVALDEYQRELERKAELDHQHAELTDALTTLEDAIRKIDRETRHLFRNTFDAINHSFGEMFPTLFGGGEAWLMLTDEDLLSTGVTIMARPPGKRNSSIYLLSGGEKALTALSLVFAIFQLNPAPFCLLDEVDAPLDDANVGRYAEAVANMAQSVQFIYITHNKIAMERAEQLMGVTMSEPGVSRMVSVDIERAVELATHEQE
jgi:chromosome segregation protein